MSVEITDNTDEFLDEFAKAKRRALERIGLQAVAYTVRELSKPKPHADGSMRPTVDTGLLRNSITYAIGGEQAHISSYTADKGNGKGAYSGKAPNGEDTVYIGTNVEYAAFVECGTRRMSAQPYLRPAVEEHRKTYERIVKDEFGE